jgi:hypothetical protein
MKIINVIYMIYTKYIPVLNLSYDDIQYILGVYPLKTFYNISVPVTYRFGHVTYPAKYKLGL